MGKIKKWFEKFKKSQKTRNRESNRDLDFFENDLVYLLKLIFVKGEVSEKDLTKKLRLRDKEKFEFLTDFALNRRYASWYKEGDSDVYTITKRGIEYLLETKKIRKEEKHSNIIKLAMIVLAISAFVQIVDIWINKPSTKEAIVILIMNALGITFGLIKDLIPLAIIIIVLFVIFKISKKIKEKKKSYKEL